MAASQIRNYRLLLVVFAIPVFWTFFSQLGIFDNFYRPLKNMAMDWRYKVRGPVEVPEAKVVYADVDAATISRLGERPWSRTVFAQVAEILFVHGKARTVGIDFIFSQSGHSDMVPEERVKEADLKLGFLVRTNPNLVLAANYTASLLPYTLEERQLDLATQSVQRKLSTPPLFYNYADTESLKQKEAETFPEMPTFPVIGQTYLSPQAQIQLSERSGLPLKGTAPGSIGLILVDTHRSGDAVPRWVPLFTRSTGPYWTLNFVEGVKRFYDLTDNNIELFGDDVVVRDHDGQFLLLMPYIQEKTFFHFSIELILKYYGLGEENVEITDEFLKIRDTRGNIMVDAPLEDQQMTEVNWFSEWMDHDLNPRASIDIILDNYYNFEHGEGIVKEEAIEFFRMFEDAIVLIGPVDQTLQDLAPTPFDPEPVPKVGVHGNMIKTLLSGHYIQRMDTSIGVVMIFLLTAVVALLGLYSGRFSFISKVLSFVFLFGYVAFVFMAFNAWHLVVPLIAPVASAVTTTTAGALIQLLLEERQKGRIKGMFGTYLSPELVNNMIESGEEPQLGGEDAVITAFFSDVQSFSSFSELLEPAQLVYLMNDYLTAMTDELMEEGAYVDKYIGDAIVAMFNAPVQLEGHAYHACIAAAKIQKRQLELRQKWKDEGDRWPDIVSRMQTRVGLNTGNATVGNMGSESRFNYTMMGDTVNLAARCESGAKTAGVYTLATAETRKAALESGDTVVFRFVDKWQVKGRSQPVDMYEVVGLREDLTDGVFECIKIYEEGLQQYFEQNWDAAAKLFAQSAELEPNQPGKTPGVTTNPSLVLLARCTDMKNNPPGNDWDGVYVMKTK